jgi:hypothetical protein
MVPPDIVPGCPSAVPQNDTVDAFIQAFATNGYSPCADGLVEFGHTKVVLFVVGTTVEQAARLLTKELWWSKMGSEEDIEHEINAVSGPLYDQPVQFLRRPEPEAVPPIVETAPASPAFAH